MERSKQEKLVIPGEVILPAVIPTVRVFPVAMVIRILLQAKRVTMAIRRTPMLVSRHV